MGKKEIIIVDGKCVLCNSITKWLIKKDKLVISPVPKSKIVLVFEKCFFIVFKKYLNFFFK